MAQITGNSAGVAINGIKKTMAGIKRWDKTSEKAMRTAIKVEAFSMRGRMQKQIKKGAPGRTRFQPLSYIARRLNISVKTGGGTTKRQRPNRNPLAMLVRAVRYRVSKTGKFSVQVGFVEHTTGSRKLGRHWRRIAKLQQKGFTRLIPAGLRKMIIARGAGLLQAKGFSSGDMNGKTPFFLRKTTRQFRTPGRKIVQPFWQKERDPAMQQIRQNYRKKMKGERI